MLFRPQTGAGKLFLKEITMGIDAVVVGAIASVVISIVVVGVIAYNIVKQAGQDQTQD
jgi:hypothetical protein